MAQRHPIQLMPAFPDAIVHKMRLVQVVESPGGLTGAVAQPSAPGVRV